VRRESHRLSYRLSRPISVLARLLTRPTAGREVCAPRGVAAPGPLNRGVLGWWRFPCRRRCIV
jgi:hypothetical protein